MPEEGRLFATVDRNYKDIMRHLDKDQHVCFSLNILLIIITYFFIRLWLQLV
jgi:hypothetical protein